MHVHISNWVYGGDEADWVGGEWFLAGERSLCLWGACAAVAEVFLPLLCAFLVVESFFLLSVRGLFGGEAKGELVGGVGGRRRG